MSKSKADKWIVKPSKTILEEEWNALHPAEQRSKYLLARMEILVLRGKLEDATGNIIEGDTER